MVRRLQMTQPINVPPLNAFPVHLPPAQTLLVPRSCLQLDSSTPFICFWLTHRLSLVFTLFANVLCLWTPVHAANWSTSCPGNTAGVDSMRMSDTGGLKPCGRPGDGAAGRHTPRPSHLQLILSWIHLCIQLGVHGSSLQFSVTITVSYKNLLPNNIV